MVNIRDLRGEHAQNIGQGVGGALGTAVGGPLGGFVGSAAGRVLAEIIAGATVQTGRQNTNPLDLGVAKEVAPQVVENALSDPRMQAIIKHVNNQTNNEPATKSKVYQGTLLAGGGSVVVIVTSILALGDLIGFDWSKKEASLTALVFGLITGGGALWAWYGRYRASKRPIVGT